MIGKLLSTPMTYDTATPGAALSLAWFLIGQQGLWVTPCGFIKHLPRWIEESNLSSSIKELWLVQLVRCLPFNAMWGTRYYVGVPHMENK